MLVEDTKDLVETADYVIIEAVLVDDGLRYKQLHERLLRPAPG